MSDERIPCPCPGCDQGAVDTGGTTPWGAPIAVQCGWCGGVGTITKQQYDDMLAEEARLKSLVEEAKKPVL